MCHGSSFQVELCNQQVNEPTSSAFVNVIVLPGVSFFIRLAQNSLCIALRREGRSSSSSFWLVRKTFSLLYMRTPLIVKGSCELWCYNRLAKRSLPLIDGSRRRRTIVPDGVSCNVADNEYCYQGNCLVSFFVPLRPYIHFFVYSRNRNLVVMIINRQAKLSTIENVAFAAREAIPRPVRQFIEQLALLLRRRAKVS